MQITEDLTADNESAKFYFEVKNAPIHPPSFERNISHRNISRDVIIEQFSLISTLIKSSKKADFSRNSFRTQLENVKTHETK